jgi:hypothetical protein
MAVAASVAIFVAKFLFIGSVAVCL